MLLVLPGRFFSVPWFVYGESIDDQADWSVPGESGVVEVPLPPDTAASSAVPAEESPDKEKKPRSESSLNDDDDNDTDGEQEQRWQGSDPRDDRDPDGGARGEDEEDIPDDGGGGDGAQNAGRAEGKTWTLRGPSVVDGGDERAGVEVVETFGDHVQEENSRRDALQCNGPGRENTEGGRGAVTRDKTKPSRNVESDLEGRTPSDVPHKRARMEEEVLSGNVEGGTGGGGMDETTDGVIADAGGDDFPSSSKLDEDVLLEKLLNTMDPSSMFEDDHHELVRKLLQSRGGADSSEGEVGSCHEVHVVQLCRVHFTFRSSSS